MQHEKDQAFRDTATRRFGKKSKWTLLIASFVLALLFAELVLRTVWHNPYQHDGPDRVVKLRMQHARTHHRIDRSAIHPDKPNTLLRTDSRSYLLPSFQYEQPDCTIVFLGGSTTECCAVDEATRFPALVSTTLAERDLHVNTLNAGTSGNTLHDSINVYFNHALQDKPDIVVLMHACNDVGVLVRGEGYRSREGAFLTWPLLANSWLKNLTNHSYVLAIMRQTLREHTHFFPEEPEEKLLASDAASPKLDGEYEKRLRTFVRMCHATGAKPVVMTQPTSGCVSELTPDWIDTTVQMRFNDLVRRVGAEEDAMVVDLVKHLEDEVPNWREPMNIFYDGVHVTDRGSTLYGRHITESLLPLVRSIVNKSAEEKDQKAFGTMANAKSELERSR